DGSVVSGGGRFHGEGDPCAMGVRGCVAVVGQAVSCDAIGFGNALTHVAVRRMSMEAFAASS
ncbi:MAG: hypothetical protein ABIW82_10795, partial [Dokdonella sp.]